MKGADDDGDFRYIFALFSIPFAAALGAIISQFDIELTPASFAAFFLFVLYASVIVVVGGLAFDLISQRGLGGIGLMHFLGGTTPLSALLLFLTLGNADDAPAFTAGMILLILWFVAAVGMAMLFYSRKLKRTGLEND